MRKLYFVIALCMFILFILLSILVFNGTTFKLDNNIMKFIYSIRGNKNNALYYIVRFLTEFGSYIVISLIFIIIGIYYKFNKKFWFIALTFLITILFGYGLKKIIQRVRPDELNWWMNEDSFSFPSGHTLASSCLYLIIFLVFKHENINKTIKNIIRILCIVILVIVPITRLILGVHYLTDLIGGLLLTFSVVFLMYPIYLSYIND